LGVGGGFPINKAIEDIIEESLDKSDSTKLIFMKAK
jgi:hypothetical protein